MPLYDWKCDDCNLELTDKLMCHNDPVPICENCKKEMSKVIGRTSFRLKGAGWYETDGKSGKDRKNLHEYGYGSINRDDL